MESRLMREVREKRGLTYGIYTYTVDKDHADYWTGSVASANDRVAETIEVIRDEWRKLREQGITAEELQDAKTYLTGAYPLRFDGNGPIANIMVNMQASDMGIDYIETRNPQIEAVTLEDANRIARELLDPDALTFVVVGRPQGLSN
jgi:zinc protease